MVLWFWTWSAQRLHNAHIVEKHSVTHVRTITDILEIVLVFLTGPWNTFKNTANISYNFHPYSLKILLQNIEHVSALPTEPTPLPAAHHSPGSAHIQVGGKQTTYKGVGAHPNILYHQVAVWVFSNQNSHEFYMILHLLFGKAPKQQNLNKIIYQTHRW